MKSASNAPSGKEAGRRSSEQTGSGAMQRALLSTGKRVSLKQAYNAVTARSNHLADTRENKSDWSDKSK